mmetsp:Transcript_7311/g.8890  ORF Transcript_7311/g.8890 Transcript_7311/m.8890 type:complete len:362 (-) Transcript_7311:96-1181(-)|eukprot:jgi/Bigna1/55653/estExt_Genewise1Plus.C_660120
MTLTNAEIGFILVIVAGLATSLGASLVYFSFFASIANKKFLAGCLGLAAGVMLYVSFVEIFVKSHDSFVEGGYKDKEAYGLATALFFAGIVMIQAVDWLVHLLSGYEDDLQAVCKVALEAGEDNSNGGHHSTVKEEKKGQPNPQVRASSLTGVVVGGSEANKSSNPKMVKGAMSDIELTSSVSGRGYDGGAMGRDPHKERLNKMGMMTALAIGIHNLPEGLATFLGALDDPTVGAALAIAIGIHNIPEGLCVAIPIYYSTGSRHRAFFWALVSGISEIVGAAIGYAVVVAAGGSISQFAYGVLFGLVAGMMVSICIKELLPTAMRYDPKDAIVTYSVVVGMAIMALSLVLFALASPEDDDE